MELESMRSATTMGQWRYVPRDESGKRAITVLVARERGLLEFIGRSPLSNLSSVRDPPSANFPKDEEIPCPYRQTRLRTKTFLLYFLGGLIFRIFYSLLAVAGNSIWNIWSTLVSRLPFDLSIKVPRIFNASIIWRFNSIFTLPVDLISNFSEI